MIKTQWLKGFRDFLPEEMRIRSFVLKTLKEVFEAYGFEPLETPTLEYASTLLGKYGKEADKLVYTFEDKGGREVGLIYDLTVPVSKVLAQYSGKIPLPFKKYQIQKVFRAEKPQKGRFREILMCDVDIFGVKSPLAEAEIISLIVNVLTKLKIENFKIKINSRQVLFQLLEKIGIKEKKLGFLVLQSLDKLTKIGQEKVSQELTKKGLALEKIKQLWQELSNIQMDENLNLLFKYLKNYQIDQKYFEFAPTMVRGLDYYTGPIFETVIEKPNIGSISGGGRFDKLVQSLGGPDLPATGTTFGLDRICEVLKANNLLPPNLKQENQILILNNPECLNELLTLTSLLRKNNLNVDFYLDNNSWSKQLAFANIKGFLWAIIIGPDEAKQNKVSLKNLKTGSQQLVDTSKLISILKS